MKIVQMVKKLNNTELGKGGTHDTYVLIPNDLSAGDEIIFERAESGNNIRHFINIQKYDESLVVQNLVDGTSLLSSCSGKEIKELLYFVSGFISGYIHKIWKMNI